MDRTMRERISPKTAAPAVEQADYARTGERRSSGTAWNPKFVLLSWL